jgi:hypothetical protein
MVHIRYSRWTASGGDSSTRVGVRSIEREHERHGRSAAGHAPADAEGTQARRKANQRYRRSLSQVAREMRKLYDEYKLQSAMDEVQEKLDSVVDQEQQTLEEMDQSAKMFRKTNSS